MTMMHHSVNDNTGMGLVISFFKLKLFHQFNPPLPELPQILDIYSVVVQKNLRFCQCLLELLGAMSNVDK